MDNTKLRMIDVQQFSKCCQEMVLHHKKKKNDNNAANNSSCNVGHKMSKFESRKYRNKWTTTLALI